MLPKLETPFARAIALVAVLIGIGSAYWRYSEVPPGNLLQTSAATVKVRPGTGAYFPPDGYERPEEMWQYDMRLSPAILQGSCPPGGLDSWPTAVPLGLRHWGLFLCNEAKAPTEFLVEMKPYMRNAVLRDGSFFVLRVFAIPLAGILSAIAFLSLTFLMFRATRWIRTGS